MTRAMRPSFHPSLVNGPCGDPALYVDSLFERRALLFSPRYAGEEERLRREAEEALAS